MTPWIERCAGVLLHPGSLPGGCLDDAQRFLDFACASGFRVWQTLPVGPVDRSGSPYQPDSALAGNPGLIGRAAPPDADELARFVERNADWLDDYALFAALERRHGADWTQWPVPIRDRKPEALRQVQGAYAPEIAEVKAQQYVFEREWVLFKRLVNDRGVRLFGDVPLFVGHHSADVWVHRGLFEVGPDGKSEASVGVPPDAFTKEGQSWGFPPYRWEAMAAEDYGWWKRRFEIQAQRFDLIRVDHFRGLSAFWRISAAAGSPAGGEWVAGPGRGAIDALRPVLGAAQLVAEDLGYITEDVIALRHAVGLPGMRVLQFAFDGDPENLHLPHKHGPDSVCYTGTHDNDTTLGWWNTLEAHVRANVCRYLGQDDPQMPGALVERAWSSPAPLAVVPMQDLLGLGNEARMNLPGTESGNWAWRFRWEQVPPDLAGKIRDRLSAHGRLLARP